VAAGRLGVDVRVIVVRIEPALFEFSLVQRTRSNRMTGAWNIDVAPGAAALALNAGQFKETGPWGWLVLDGAERRDPGFGPLATGIAFDSAGCLRWIPFAELDAARRDRSIRFAFQSYPTLLFDGRVPALARSQRDVDQDHRDARLLLAQEASGKLLILLTRYDGLGRAAARVPIGLTVPESIVLIGELGATHAIMLDGGVSAQLLVRDQHGATRAWKGLRDVPLALIAIPR
jgi:exopolysaccharide biosynthesis protein